MLPVKRIPISTPKWLLACVSVATSLTYIQWLAKEGNRLLILPQPVQRFVLSILLGFFKRSMPESIQRFTLSIINRGFFKIRRLFYDHQPMTLKIEEYHGLLRNEVYTASKDYLQTKISPFSRLLTIAQTSRETTPAFHFVSNQEFEDAHEGIELKWKFTVLAKKKEFELTFDVRHKEKVVESYLPFVLDRFKAMKQEQKIVKLHTLVSLEGFKIKWDAIKFGNFTATFETLAMDPELKMEVMEDLDRFVKRREFYQRVGRAWKRGYLLYGPPGTGKSSLIAAMANHLKYDIYDLQLTHLHSDMELRRVLVSTTNKSILVVEDIDCSQPKLQDRERVRGSKRESEGYELTLSGLLNFIDGLWSGCGEERIIVFTTNHKNKLDPALLRPGRMDKHIHMSYCTYEGFKTLARNYLGLYEHHPLSEEIERLLQNASVAPAQVAEKLMDSENVEVALQGLITLLENSIKLKRGGENVNQVQCVEEK